MWEVAKATNWNHLKNKLFENALAKFDKDTPYWWKRVSEMHLGYTIMWKYMELKDDVISSEAGLYPKCGYNNNMCAFTLKWGQ